MSKFFNVVSDKKKKKNTYIQEQSGQGVISPTYNQDTETFVYDSYSKNNITNNVNYMNNINSANQVVQSEMNPENITNSSGQLNNASMQGEYINNQNVNVVKDKFNDLSNNIEIQENVMQVSESNQMISLQNGSSYEINEFGNPVSSDETDIEKENVVEDVKVKFFTVIGMILGMIMKPGTTITSNVKKYKSIFKALGVTLWITVITLLLCIVSRVVLGSFVKSYNSVTGFGSITFDFSNIFNLNNYLEYLIIAFLISFVAIIILSIVYYASSFINSKGVHMGTYFMVSNLAMIPFIIGVVILYPVLSLISTYLGVLALIFSFLYTLVSFLIGISEVLVFKNINRKILYNAINLSIVLILMFMLITFLGRINVITIISLNI